MNSSIGRVKCSELFYSLKKNYIFNQCMFHPDCVDYQTQNGVYILSTWSNLVQHTLYSLGPFQPTSLPYTAQRICVQNLRRVTASDPQTLCVHFKCTRTTSRSLQSGVITLHVIRLGPEKSS